MVAAGGKADGFYNFEPYDCTPGEKWEGFLDNGAVIVGGLPKYLWGTTASPVTSSEGFLGCVGKVQLNGNTMFLQRQARQIEKGCSGPLVACRKCARIAK